MNHFPTFTRWFVAAVTIYARIRWIFSGDKDGMAAQTQGIAGAFNTTFPVLKRENMQLAELLRDLRQRLDHHEAGPLQASRRELERRRADGMVKPIDAKRNGGRKVIAPAPASLLCVHGRKHGECDACPGSPS